MFTGIVEGIGTVNKISKITKNRSAIEMTIDLGKQVKGLKIGQSVALNGVCLTATKISKSKCIFEHIPNIIQNSKNITYIFLLENQHGAS